MSCVEMSSTVILHDTCLCYNSFTESEPEMGDQTAENLVS